jgi:hypothetical protein
MKCRNQVILPKKGARYGLALKDHHGQPELLAFVWQDWDRCYFICSGGSMAEGNPHIQERMRQVVKDDVSLPQKVTFSIPQPKAAKLYYDTCGKIDQRNRDRQAKLGLKVKLKTQDWSKHVRLTILLMCIMDAWKVWSRITTDPH